MLYHVFHYIKCYIAEIWIAFLTVYLSANSNDNIFVYSYYIKYANDVQLLFLKYDDIPLLGLYQVDRNLQQNNAILNKLKISSFKI